MLTEGAPITHSTAWLDGTAEAKQLTRQVQQECQSRLRLEEDLERTNLREKEERRLREHLEEEVKKLRAILNNQHSYKSPTKLVVQLAA